MRREVVASQQQQLLNTFCHATHLMETKVNIGEFELVYSLLPLSMDRHGYVLVKQPTNAEHLRVCEFEIWMKKSTETGRKVKLTHRAYSKSFSWFFNSITIFHCRHLVATHTHTIVQQRWRIQLFAIENQPASVVISNVWINAMLLCWDWRPTGSQMNKRSTSKNKTKMVEINGNGLVSESNPKVVCLQEKGDLIETPSNSYFT